MKIGNVTFDCSDALALSAFWSKVVERPVAAGATEDFAVIGGAPNLLFIKVPEDKAAKNRCHVDLDADAPLLEVRARLEGFGADFVHEQQEFGISWMTFTDPEGNEFCVGEH
jgi:catechol 2,3-dioxygenase-like lactoylglutathione lyase family enzyme